MVLLTLIISYNCKVIQTSAYILLFFKIDIDFDLMYPGKGFHLLSKWQEFRQKIMCYYEDNIINEHCKAQLLLLKTAPTYR